MSTIESRTVFSSIITVMRWFGRWNWFGIGIKCRWNGIKLFAAFEASEAWNFTEACNKCHEGMAVSAFSGNINKSFSQKHSRQSLMFSLHRSLYFFSYVCVFACMINLASVPNGRWEACNCSTNKFDTVTSQQLVHKCKATYFDAHAGACIR